MKILKIRSIGVLVVLMITSGLLSAPSGGVSAQAPERPIVLIAGNDRPPLNDRPLLARLEATGHPVVIVDDAEAASALALQPIMIAISTSVTTTTFPAAELASWNGPILTWEPHITAGLAMADVAGVTSAARPRRHVDITDPRHPLAADQGSRAYVLSWPSTVGWSQPGPGAQVVATVAGQPDKPVVYTYPAGAEMATGEPAPGCRTFLFPSWESAGLLSSIGVELFDAAIDHTLDCGAPDRPGDPDGDGDGAPSSIDCDDDDPTRYPGAPEIPDDGIDQDCDGRDAVTPVGGEITNVVMVLVDDMRLDEYAYLPKTQALLGGEGVTFGQAVHNTPLCCPARATLLTGQRSKNHDVNTNKPADGEGYLALDHTNTLATWFQDAGWFTSHVGKYMNGYGQDGLYAGIPNSQEVTPGWTDFQTLVKDIKYFDYTINDNGTLVDHGTDPDDYQTDVLARRATESIDDAVAAGQPFYLWVSTQSPHGYNGNPPDAAPRHESMFDGAVAPQAPSWGERDVSDKPGYVRSAARLTAADIRAFNSTWEHRLEALQSVDDLVETLYDKLVEVDALDDTLIIFFSDNGYLLGEHRLTGKLRPYEESIRVPLIMRGGPFVGGATVDHLVSSVDIVPTIVAQTGVTPGLTMDGLDLSQVLTDPERYDDRAVIVEIVAGPGYDAIRTERWMWVEYYGSARELYDLSADPHQLDSKHRAGGVYQEVREELSALLATQRNCTGAACVVYSDR